MSQDEGPPRWTYECPTADGKLHSWMKDANGFAVCQNCSMRLNAQETRDCYGEGSEDYDDQTR